MNIIDILDPENPDRYIAADGRFFNIPRLKGITQIKAGKVSAEALAHYNLVEEVVTTPGNPDDVLQDPQQVSGVWTTVWAPRQYDIDQRRASAVQQINDRFQAIISAANGQYPAYEMATWPDQEQEALAYQAWVANGSVAANKPACTVLNGIIADRNAISGEGLTLAAFVPIVLANAEKWRPAGASGAGMRQGYVVRVYNAADKPAIDAVLADLSAVSQA